jgi:hypothetical protein
MVIRFYLKKKLSCVRAGTAAQAAAHSARWGYHGLPSQPAVRAAKIKLIVASRRALRKRTVKFLQRMVVSALRARPAAPLGIAERWHRNLSSLAKERNPGYS